MDGGDVESAGAGASTTMRGGQPQARPSATTTTTTTTTSPKPDPALRHRAPPPKPRPPPRSAAPALANARRPPTWRVKTMLPQWRGVRSRWRYLEGMLFYLGPPSFLAARVLPAMALNLAVFALVAADHIYEALSARKAAHAMAAGHPAGRVGGLLPPLSPSVAASLDPVFRLSLFAVSLLLTLRLGRVVDRWWTARRAFAAFGSVALAIAQRTCLGLGGEDPDTQAGAAARVVGGGGGAAAAARRVGKGEAARWAVVWQASMFQLLTYSAALHPAAAALLSPVELEMYASHPKGRQFASQRLTQLLLGDDGGAAVGGPLVAASLLDRAAVAQGDLTSIFMQALPAAVTTMSTGATEAFLLLYPLSALTRSSGGGGSGGSVVGMADPAMAASAAPKGEVTAMSAAAMAGGHDMSLPSVLFTLGVQGLLYAFVCLLFLSLCATAAELENPYAHIPMENMLRTTVRDVARALDEDGRVRAALDGGKGAEPNAFDWSEALRLAAKTEEEKGR